MRTLTPLLALLLLSTSLPAQETWSFDHHTESLTVAPDGSIQIGGDALSFVLAGNGIVTIPAEGVDFSVSAGRDLMIGRTSERNEATMRIVTRRPASLTPSEMLGT